MIRKITAWPMLAATFICVLSGCSAAQQQPANVPPPRGEKKILIVYLSRTGNTEAIAKMIQGTVGGDLVSLELEKPYPKEYRAIVQQVDRENDEGYLPTLITRIDDLQQYGTIFLGFPTWDMQLPPPMKSFLSKNDLSGKTVIPFNTNGGYGVGSSFQDVRELCPESVVLEGFATRGGSERDGQLLAIKEEVARNTQKEVVAWLRKIAVLN